MKRLIVGILFLSVGTSLFAGNKYIDIINAMPYDYYGDTFSSPGRMIFPNYRLTLRNGKWRTVSLDKKTEIDAFVDLKNGYVSVFDDKYKKNGFVSRKFDAAIFTYKKSADIIVGVSILDVYEDHTYSEWKFYRYGKLLKNNEAKVNDHSTSEYEFIDEEKYPGIVNKLDSLKYLLPDEVKRLDDNEKVIIYHFYMSIPRQGTDIVFIFRKVDLLKTLEKR